jgi:hypothetical protein
VSHKKTKIARSFSKDDDLKGGKGLKLLGALVFLIFGSTHFQFSTCNGDCESRVASRG